MAPEALRRDQDEPVGLAIYDTVRWAIVFVFQHFGSLLKVSATPFLLSFLLTVAENALTVAVPALHGPVLVLVFQFLLTAVLVPQATAWHRYTLLDGQRLRWFQCVVGCRELRFCGYAFLGYAGLLLSGYAGASLYRTFAEFAVATQLLLAVLGIWFLARFAAVLPAAAIGVRLSLRQAYAATRGGASKIMGIYVVTALMMTTFGMGFDALGSIAASFFSTVTPWTTIVAETAPRAFFNLLSVGVSITLLSVIFKQIWAPAGSPDAA